MALRDLLLSIGIDANTKGLNELDDKVDKVVNNIKDIDTKAIDKIPDAASDAASNMDKLATSAREVPDGLDTAAKKVKDVGDEAGKSSGAIGKLKGAIGGMLAAVAAAGVISFASSFATSSIEAAANLQAMSAQFDQVFGGLGGKAQTAIDTMGDDFGMLPNRIKPAYTMMTSMFKGLGLDTEAAMNASQRAVTATADAAAFYDQSFEDANSALNSFIKGNYEGGESIGLFANETQLASWASKELGVNWDNLSEADKQLNRLQFAEQMLKSAEATGQASRESGSYQNQLGNLKQSWTDLMAKFGTPILEQAVGVLQWLSDVLSGIDPTPFMEFISTGVDGLQQLSPVLDAVGQTFQSIFTGEGDVGSIWAKLGVPPELLSGIESYAGTATSMIDTLKGAVSSFVNEIIIPLIPVAQDTIASSSGFINGAIDGVSNVFGTLSSIIMGVINGVIVPLFPVARSVIETSMNVISPILRIVGSLFSGISSVIRFLVENIVVPLFPIIPSVIGAAWAVLRPILSAIGSAFDVVADSVEWVVDKIQKLSKILSKLNIGEKIGGAVKAVSKALPGFEVGLGRVPMDDMPALLHKDEAVLPAHEADMLRNAGILKGDGTDPQLDFGSENEYANSAPVSVSKTATTVKAPVQIIVQGGKTDEKTSVNIKEALEEFFADLTLVMD